MTIQSLSQSSVCWPSNVFFSLLNLLTYSYMLPLRLQICRNKTNKQNWLQNLVSCFCNISMTTITSVCVFVFFVSVSIAAGGGAAWVVWASVSVFIVYLVIKTWFLYFAMFHLIFLFWLLHHGHWSLKYFFMVFSF